MEWSQTGGRLVEQENAERRGARSMEVENEREQTAMTRERPLRIP